MDRKKVSVLAAAGVVVATLFGGAAFALSGNGDERPERDTLPVGQLVSTPASTTPTSSAEPAAVAGDIGKDAAVPNPAPQPVQPKVAADEPTNPPAPEPTFTHPPYVPTAPGDTAPAPPPPAPCYWDDSDPVNFPNGREVCP